MSEIDTVKMSLQSLANDVQVLSASFKTASQNIQSSSSQVMGQANSVLSASRSVSSGAGGFYGSVLTTPMSQQGFTGYPTSAQYSGGVGVPILGASKDSIFTAFTKAGSNEYNKNPNWFRDILALNNKNFIDVDSETAKKRASRNWNLRGKEMGMDAVGLGLAFALPLGTGIVAGAAWEFVAKPMIMAEDREKNAYWNWLDQTGYRNIGAKWSSQSEGGLNDSDKEELSNKMAVMHKGTGWKRSQVRDLMSSLEQSGYFKTYDKTSVDQMADRARKGIRDAEYAMKTLHVTAQEAAKILGDVNQLSGFTPAQTTGYINRLGAASAYTGLSGMQVNEAAAGRAAYFKQFNYSGMDAQNAGLREIVNYYKGVEQGKRPDYSANVDMKQRLVEQYRSEPSSAALMLADFKIENGKWVADWNSINGNLSMTQKYERGLERFNSLTQDQRNAVSGGALLSMTDLLGMTPEVANDYFVYQSIQAAAMKRYGKSMDWSTMSPATRDAYTGQMATELGVSRSKVEEVMGMQGDTDWKQRSRYARIGLPEGEHNPKKQPTKNEKEVTGQEAWKSIKKYVRSAEGKDSLGVAQREIYGEILASESVMKAFIGTSGRNDATQSGIENYANKIYEERYGKYKEFATKSTKKDMADIDKIVKKAKELEKKGFEKGHQYIWEQMQIYAMPVTKEPFWKSDEKQTSDRAKLGLLVAEAEKMGVAGKSQIFNSPFSKLIRRTTGINIEAYRKADAETAGLLENIIKTGYINEWDAERRALRSDGRYDPNKLREAQKKNADEMSEMLKKAGLTTMESSKISRYIEENAGIGTKGQYMLKGEGQKAGFTNANDVYKSLQDSFGDSTQALIDIAKTSNLQTDVLTALTEANQSIANASKAQHAVSEALLAKIG